MILVHVTQHSIPTGNPVESDVFDKITRNCDEQRLSREPSRRVVQASRPCRLNRFRCPAIPLLQEEPFDGGAYIVTADHRV